MTNMPTTKSLLVLGAAVIAVSTAWGGPADADEDDTLVIARDMDVDSLDPARASGVTPARSF